MVTILILLATSFAHALSVDVSSLLPPDQKEIQDSFKSDSSLNGAKIDQLIKKLMKSGKYDRVEAHREGERLSFRANVIKTVNSIKITGTKTVSKGDLMDLVEDLEGQRLDRKKSVEAGETLKKFLADNGYLDSEVSFTQTPHDPQSVDIT